MNSGEVVTGGLVIMEPERNKEAPWITKQRLSHSRLFCDKAEARTFLIYERIHGESNHFDQMNLITVITLLGF